MFAVTDIDWFCNVGIYRLTFLLHISVWLCVQVIDISQLVLNSKVSQDIRCLYKGEKAETQLE
jgi:hypothetical protein